MSSPSGRSEETRSQDSVHTSSQFAARMALEDTALLVHHTGRLPGSSSTVTSRAPNATFLRGMSAARARSASLGPRRSLSPLGLLVMQHCVRLAERIAAMAMSRVRCVEAETRCVCEIVEAPTAEARPLHDEVQSRVASLAASADASTLCTAEEIAGRVKEVVAYSDVQASRVAVEVMQRLESEILAVASSTSATTDITMRTAVEGVRRDIQAQLEQNRVDALRREEEAKHRVEQISTQLQQLAEQLNKFRLASEHAVGVVQDKVDYLGFEVGHDGIRTSLEKVRAILDWARPQPVHDARSSLGLASYYCKFIKGFSQLAKPMTDPNRDKVA